MCFAQRRHDRWADREVRDEVTVHHIDVEHVDLARRRASIAAASEAKSAARIDGAMRITGRGYRPDSACEVNTAAYIPSPVPPADGSQRLAHRRVRPTRWWRPVRRQQPGVVASTTRRGRVPRRRSTCTRCRRATPRAKQRHRARHESVLEATRSSMSVACTRHLASGRRRSTPSPSRGRRREARSADLAAETWARSRPSHRGDPHR